MRRHSKTSLVLYFAAILSPAALAQESNHNAPSYEDTLHYIQERLDGGLEETGHCQFVYHGSANETFDAKLLSPHLSWEEKHEASVNCTGGKQCVQHSGFDKPRDFWVFRIKKDTNRGKIEKALLHLLNLCGVRSANQDLF